MKLEIRRRKTADYVDRHYIGNLAKSKMGLCLWMPMALAFPNRFTSLVATPSKRSARTLWVQQIGRLPDLQHGYIHCLMLPFAFVSGFCWLTPSQLQDDFQKFEFSHLQTLAHSVLWIILSTSAGIINRWSLPLLTLRYNFKLLLHPKCQLEALTAVFRSSLSRAISCIYFWIVESLALSVSCRQTMPETRSLW